VTRFGPFGFALAAVGLGYWTAYRPTSQTFGPFPYQAEVSEPLVALTFDDGPNEPYTSQLLDVLDERGVRATFFQVGRCAERFPSASRRVVESGHVLGNHSYSHQFSNYFREPSQRREIERSQQVLASVTGVVPALYRPPWLCHWPWVLGSIRDHGLQVVSGLFGHPLEIIQPPARVMAASAAKITKPGTILIFHDGFDARGGRRDQSVAAIGPLIDSLADRGYRFVTVDQLLGVPAYLA
jgi:peptidoglycan/xylan/chitin deacetylase (PgdA/CDA1 family)